uniref:MICOS complex subunit MIC13 n=1 Tax=Clastoptera arizonana TaxID=38151 RepID=A0A1B6DGZ2_9HEMI
MLNSKITNSVKMLKNVIIKKPITTYKYAVEENGMNIVKVNEKSRPSSEPRKRPGQGRAAPTRYTLGERLWLISKIGLFVGVVNITDELGIWSTTDGTENLVQNIKDIVYPEQDSSADQENIPYVLYTTAHYWNQFIVSFFKLLGVYA